MVGQLPPKQKIVGSIPIKDDLIFLYIFINLKLNFFFWINSANQFLLGGVAIDDSIKSQNSLQIDYIKTIWDLLV